MSMALLFYCSEDLESSHLDLISDPECFPYILNHPKCTHEIRNKIESQGFKLDNSDDANIEILNTSIKIKNRLSSQVFGVSYSKITDLETLRFLKKFVQIFTELGHPLGLLHPDVSIDSSMEYRLQTVFFEWTTSEVIYRTLWPAISETSGISFCHSINHVEDTENFYYVVKNFEVPGFNMTNHFQKYWSIDRQFINEEVVGDEWILDTQSLNYDFALELLSNYENFEDFLDENDIPLDSDVIDEEVFNTLTAMAIQQNINKDNFQITERGLKFIVQAVVFSPIYTRLNYVGLVNTASINLANSKDYGWSKITPDKQSYIIDLLTDGLNSEDDTLQYYSQYFLTTIALMQDQFDIVTKEDNYPTPGIKAGQPNRFVIRDKETKKSVF
jgi:hypothetical protein